MPLRPESETGWMRRLRVAAGSVCILGNVYETPPPPPAHSPYGQYLPPSPRPQRQARAGYIAALCIGGGLLVILGILLRVIPVYQGQTIPQWNSICSSGIGQIGQVFSSSVSSHCSLASDLNDLITPLLIVGVLLLLAGAAVAIARSARSRP